MEALDASNNKPQLNWLDGNVVNPVFNELFATPGNVVVKVANRTSQELVGHDCFDKIEMKAVADAKPGSTAFWTQTAVDGLAGAVVYAAAGKLAGGLSRRFVVGSLDELSEATVLNSQSMSLVKSSLKLASTTLAKEQVNQVLGAAVYDYSRDSGAGQTHTGNMLGGAAAFTTYELLNGPAAALPVIPRLVARLGIGAIGSIAQEGASAVGGNQVSLDSMAQSMSTGAFMNLGLPAAQHALGRAVDLVNVKLDQGIPLQRQMHYAGLDGKSARLDALVSDNAEVRVHQSQSGNVEDHLKRSVSLTGNTKDSLVYAEQLGHALAHMESAKQDSQAQLFDNAAQALNRGDTHQAWVHYRQARLNEESRALETQKLIGQQLRGGDINGGSNSATSPIADMGNTLIPATGKTYERTWFDEFETSFVPSKGLARPHYDYSTDSAEAVKPAPEAANHGTVNRDRWSVKNLQKAFQEKGYIADIPRIIEVSSGLDTKPVGGAFLFGKAGTGKSALTEITADAIGAKYFYKQAFPGTREENLLVDVLPDEHTVSGVKEYPGVLAQATDFLRNSKEQPVVLVLDEWDKTRPSADAILLDFLQNGRINHGSVNIQLTPEEMSRLKVFVALNDERELSEPLLRRLPMITFKPPEVSVVRQALEFTHGQHQLVPALLSLYQRSLVSEMAKPVTIQELRQVIDAYDNIRGQGYTPNWDSLIKQYVTKTDENHALLKRAESANIDTNLQKVVPKLDPRSYNFVEPKNTSFGNADAGLPRLFSLRKLELTPRLNGAAANLGEHTSGVLQYSKSNYDSAVSLSRGPNDDPSTIGDFARVVGDDKGKLMVFEKPVSLGKYQDILNRFWGQPGEVALVEPHASHDHVRNLQDNGLQITEYSNDRIVGQFQGGELLWTPQKGLELLVDMSKGSSYDNPLERLGIDSWYTDHGQLRQAEQQHRWRTREGSYPISLGRDIPNATITTTRMGQQPSSEGNGVIVKATLGLPALQGELHPELHFGQVTVGEGALGPSWGSSSGSRSQRTISFTGVGQTWAEATGQALDELHTDLGKLLAERRERQAALKLAEQPSPQGRRSMFSRLGKLWS